MGLGVIVRSPVQVWSQVKGAFLRTEKTQILLRGSVGTLVLRACGVGVRMASGVVLARALGATGYGVYAYAIAWLTVLTLPTTLGLDQVALRYVAAYKETRSWPALKGLLRFALVLGMGAALVVGLVSIGLVALLSRLAWDLRATLMITFAMLPIVVLTQVRQASLRGLDHPVLAQVPEFLNPVFLIAFVVVARLLSQATLTVAQVALANGAAWLTAFVIGTLFLLRHLPVHVRAAAPEYRKSEWAAMVPALVFFGAAWHVLSRGDVLILGALGTSRDVGLYTVASRGAELMLFMYDAMTLSGASLFSSIYASGDMRELQRFTSLLTKSILWVSLPAWLVFLALAPWFLRLFGPEFIEASAVMRVLATTFFVSSLGGIIIPKLHMTGHQRDVAVVTGIMAAVNVALCFLLVPRLGMMGAAIASGASLILLKGTLVVVLYQRVGIVSLPFDVHNKRGGRRDPLRKNVPREETERHS